MTYANRGGRIPPDNRPPAAKGVGKNAKRHDLERRSTPFLHDSDLQQGDVQAMENGQRVAPKRTQQPAAPPPASGGGQPAQATTGEEIPDPIDFIAGLTSGSGVNPPAAGVVSNPNVEMWLGFAQHLVNGPGSSGLLAGAYINQLRQLRRNPQTSESVYIDLQDVDAALEAALDEEANGLGG